MNMQFLPGSENSTPETDDDDPARRYYESRLKKLQEKYGLPRNTGPEYPSILKTCLRFGLINHLIFLYTRKKISKKDYIQISSLGNISIISELQKKGFMREDFF